MTSTELDPRLLYGALPAEQCAHDSLLERLRRSEPAAVGAAYDEHASAIRSFALRLIGDRAAAEDLVHEVFVTLPKAIRSYRGESALRTFLISIAVNHARHFVRAAARRRAVLERLGSEPRAAGTDPEQQVGQRQLVEALSHALDTLPLEQRVAFVLCDVEERTSAEVAVIVCVPEATVRTRLFHARRKLRLALQKEGLP